MLIGEFKMTPEEWKAILNEREESIKDKSITLLDTLFNKVCITKRYIRRQLHGRIWRA